LHTQYAENFDEAFPSLLLAITSQNETFYTHAPQSQLTPPRQGTLQDAGWLYVIL